MKAITHSAPLSASTPNVFRPLSVGKFMSYAPLSEKVTPKPRKRKKKKVSRRLPRDPGTLGFKGLSPSR